MGKTKVKKQSTFIDMTAMSDVTVLLLTFFMLTATFLPKEPVQVLTPSSVSEFKVPESNVLTILISADGKIFLNLDDYSKDVKREALKGMGRDYGMTFSDAEVRTFLEQTHIGVPMNQMHNLLKIKDTSSQDAMIKDMGVPNDSTNNQFSRWITNIRATEKGQDLTISIKADRTTPYPFVDGVMKSLVKMKENRYSLVTTLRGMPDGF